LQGYVVWWDNQNIVSWYLISESKPTGKMDISHHHDSIFPCTIACSAIKTSRHGDSILAIGHMDGTISLWNIIAGIVTVDEKILALHTTNVVSIVFVGDEWLISATTTGVVSVYSLYQNVVVYHTQTNLKIAWLYSLPKQLGIIIINELNYAGYRDTKNIFQATVWTIPTLQKIAVLTDKDGNLANLLTPLLHICDVYVANSVEMCIYDLSVMSLLDGQNTTQTPYHSNNAPFWNFLAISQAEQYHQICKQLEHF